MKPTLDATYAAIRAVTRAPADWDVTANAVASALVAALPDEDEVRRSIPLEARGGSNRSQILHVEPDGSFSVVALVTQPGQATSVHDHTTWCAVACIAGTELEERFLLGRDGECLLTDGTRTDASGTVSAFAPPGDIHRVTNVGSAVGISLHVYGTDIARIASSVRRTYDLPVTTRRRT